VDEIRALTLPLGYPYRYAALNLYGNQWEDISQHVKTRDPSQVRSHAQKFNNKLSNDKEKIGYQPIKVRD
jgi:hypothetical protein